MIEVYKYLNGLAPDIINTIFKLRQNTYNHSHKNGKIVWKHIDICILCWNLVNGPKHRGS